MELKDQGINANSISPGMVDTLSFPKELLRDRCPLQQPHVESKIADALLKKRQ
jgi:NAD(P)-dependent dehydrogenase (short-subunit alcohol dehydrogenase family)